MNLVIDGYPDDSNMDLPVNDKTFEEETLSGSLGSLIM